jgi:hypothetical protein
MLQHLLCLTFCAWIYGVLLQELERVARKFYNALILQDILGGLPPEEVAADWGVPKVQACKNIQASAVQLERD